MRIENHIHIRRIMLYYFKKGWNAAQSFRDLNELFAEGTISKSQVEKWFKKFKLGDKKIVDEEGNEKKRRQCGVFGGTDCSFAKKFIEIAK